MRREEGLLGEHEQVGGGAAETHRDREYFPMTYYTVNYKTPCPVGRLKVGLGASQYTQ